MYKRYTCLWSYLRSYKQKKYAEQLPRLKFENDIFYRHFFSDTFKSVLINFVILNIFDKKFYTVFIALQQLVT